MPKIPLGDILRALLPWKWLKAGKGISIKKGNWEVQLDEKHGGLNRGPTKFDKPR
jgi:hypothetical protein